MLDSNSGDLRLHPLYEYDIRMIYYRRDISRSSSMTTGKDLLVNFCTQMRNHLQHDLVWEGTYEVGDAALR